MTHPPCAILPFLAPTIRVDRSRYLLRHNRKVPVPKTPDTIGGHLRRRRLQLRQLQSQAARQLSVSSRTLSLWECDKVEPSWAHQSRLIAYLDFDPFDDSAVGRPKGNETIAVTSLASPHPLPFGEEVRKRRLNLRPNRKECARLLGVDDKEFLGVGDEQARTGRRGPEHDFTHVAAVPPHVVTRSRRREEAEGGLRMGRPVR